MARARRVSAAVIVAAALVLCCVCVSAGPVPSRRRRRANSCCFREPTCGATAAFIYGGLLWSARGLDREGFTLQAFGLRRALPLHLRRARQCHGDSAATVWSSCCRAGGSSAAGSSSRSLPGSTSSKTPPAPYDPSNRLHGTNVGARSAVDLWFEPTPATMIAAGRIRSARLPPAIRRASPLAGGCTIGSISARRRRLSPATVTAKSRVGVHVTGLRPARLGMVGGGRLVDRQRPARKPLSAHRRFDAPVNWTVVSPRCGGSA